MLYLKKLYTSWYSCILHINTVIVGYCYLVSHLADQTPAPSQRLFNLLRTWSDVSTFLHRGVLIVTASSHVILMAVWHDSKGTKQWNNETYICWDGVYTIVQVCNIVYIYTTVCIYIYMLYIYLHLHMQDWHLVWAFAAQGTRLCSPKPPWTPLIRLEQM